LWRKYYHSRLSVLSSGSRCWKEGGRRVRNHSSMSDVHIILASPTRGRGSFTHVVLPTGVYSDYACVSKFVRVTIDGSWVLVWFQQTRIKPDSHGVKCTTASTTCYWTVFYLPSSALPWVFPHTRRDLIYILSVHRHFSSSNTDHTRHYCNNRHCFKPTQWEESSLSNRQRSTKYGRELSAWAERTRPVVEGACTTCTYLPSSSHWVEYLTKSCVVHLTPWEPGLSDRIELHLFDFGRRGSSYFVAPFTSHYLTLKSCGEQKIIRLDIEHRTDVFQSHRSNEYRKGLLDPQEMCCFEEVTVMLTLGLLSTSPWIRTVEGKYL
jgi:hypothetical protein